MLRREYLIGQGAAGATLSTASLADICTFYLPERCRVLEVGVTPVVNAGSDAMVVKFDGTEPGASRGDGDVGVITSAASPTVGEAIRRHVDVDLAAHSTVTVQVTDAGPASSTARVYMLVEWAGKSAAEAAENDSL